jgi:hypothetical protein
MNPVTAVMPLQPQGQPFMQFHALSDLALDALRGMYGSLDALITLLPDGLVGRENNLSSCSSLNMLQIQFCFNMEGL